MLPRKKDNTYCKCFFLLSRAFLNIIIDLLEHPIKLGDNGEQPKNRYQEYMDVADMAVLQFPFNLSNTIQSRTYNKRICGIEGTLLKKKTHTIEYQIL